MKHKFRRLLTAVLASAMTFCAAGALPQTALSALAAESAAVSESKTPLLFVDALPDESELTELGSVYLAEDEWQNGFGSGKNTDILKGAEVFYVYIPKTEGAEFAGVELVFGVTDGGEDSQVKEEKFVLDAHPYAGEMIAKIDLSGSKVVSYRVTGNGFTPTEAGNGAFCDATLYRAVSHLPEDPIPEGDGVVTVSEDPPADGTLKQMIKKTFQINGKIESSSQALHLPENTEGFAGYYLYIPKQKGVGAVDLTLELTYNNNNGEDVPWVKSDLHAADISAAPLIAKIASSGTQASSICITKTKAAPAEEDPAKSFNVIFYYYLEEPEQPPQPEKPAVLRPAVLPVNAEAISSVVRLEDPSENTAFSLSNLPYHYLDAQYYADFSNYPGKTAANQENWWEFSSHIEMVFVYEKIEEVTVTDENGQETKQQIRTQSTANSGYGLPLLNGRSQKLIEPVDGGKDNWNCKYMNAECIFEGRAYSAEEPNGTEITMPPGRGALNVSAADIIGNQPYKYFYVKLSHATDQEYDETDLALLTFHVFRQNDADKWEEFRTFEALADMEKPAGGSDYTSDAVVKIPSDVLKPDNGYLYIIEPRFFRSYANADSEGRYEVTNGTGYVWLYGANPLRGDVNNDGEVTIADAVMMSKYLVTADTESKTVAAETADMNDDGIINAIDLSLLKRMILTAVK